jgi:hypothetical protein
MKQKDCEKKLAELIASYKTLALANRSLKKKNRDLEFAHHRWLEHHLDMIERLEGEIALLKKVL